MVNYKLGIFNSKQSIVEICLDSIISDGKGKLQIVDEMTSKFKDENALKTYLVNNGLLELKDFKKKINIVYKYSGEYQKLPIIYNSDKQYLDNTYLYYKLKGMSSNPEFLEKLANHYSIGNSKFNPQGLNVSDIRIYLGDVRQCGYSFDSKLLSTALSDMHLKATTTVDKKTGELKENYRGLRDLALFIIRYEKRQELLKQKEKLISIEKKKSELNKIIESFNSIMGEQISIFDLIDKKNDQFSDNKKFILSSEGDPDFPPNSEEERMYNKYLENLPDEDYLEDDHGHYKK